MNITSEQVQKYARIVLYWIAGALVTHGVGNESWIEPGVGLGLTLINFAWTLYGDRIVAKLNEVAKFDVVDKVVVNDRAIVSATTSKVQMPPKGKS